MNVVNECPRGGGNQRSTIVNHQRIDDQRSLNQQ
jgi:hypothetical protein